MSISSAVHVSSRSFAISRRSAASRSFLVLRDPRSHISILLLSARPIHRHPRLLVGPRSRSHHLPFLALPRRLVCYPPELAGTTSALSKYRLPRVPRIRSSYYLRIKE